MTSSYVEYNVVCALSGQLCWNVQGNGSLYSKETIYVNQGSKNAAATATTTAAAQNNGPKSTFKSWKKKRSAKKKKMVQQQLLQQYLQWCKIQCCLHKQ